MCDNIRRQGGEIMSVVSILSEVLDSRKGSNLSKFNGYLEDFLNSDAPISDEVKETLTKVLEEYPDFRIITDFRFNVNKKAISNQIIRYRDLQKLPNNYFDLSFILYGQIGEREVGILVAHGNRKLDYFLAKGLYYCLTEQYAILEESRSELVAITYADLGEIVNYLDSLKDGKLRVGPLQRRIDRKYYNGFYDLQNHIMEYANKLKEDIRTDIFAVEDRSVVIFRNIASWFLFKKLIYIQYMSNKDFLNTKAEGNIKKHRSHAKEAVDAVPYIAFSEMWRMKEEE